MDIEGEMKSLFNERNKQMKMSLFYEFQFGLEGRFNLMLVMIHRSFYRPIVGRRSHLFGTHRVTYESTFLVPSKWHLVPIICIDFRIFMRNIKMRKCEVNFPFSIFLITIF